MFLHGGCGGPLQVDHTLTRRDRDPAKLQTLCERHNMAKGSRKGKGWDFRSERFIGWMADARNRDWIFNQSHQDWERLP
jgi:hypothetical protein